MRHEKIFPHGTQILVLLSMRRRKGRVLASEIEQDIRKATGTPISRPHVHRTLNDMVAKNLVTKFEVHDFPDRRRHHGFKLTASGHATIKWLAQSFLDLDVIKAVERR